MKKYLLVINAGSSSIKFAIYQVDPSGALIEDATGQIEGIGCLPNFTVNCVDANASTKQTLAKETAPDHGSAIGFVCQWLWAYFAHGELLAVGHRVVHGGAQYAVPVLVDAGVLADLEALTPLAPLHQPHNLATIRSLLASNPALPQVACFDTAFHSTQAPVAQRLALPRRYTDEGLRAYGFHGLSYEYIASVLPTHEPTLAHARVIVAHLGSGASLCALRDGRSVATTMSFSPLDGLVMGTRCGSLDPSVLLYLMDRHGMDARALEDLLYHQSGLLGVSGIASDMRTLLASTHPDALEAIELFVYRIGREIGSLVAALGGLDALVFTGGIGEHSPEIRAQVCLQAAWLGLAIDEASNAEGAIQISSVDSKVSAWVLPTNENLMIARQTLALIPLPAQ
ncbi:MAG: acetate/propionate family kinase [Methylococcales bacterium]|nr:acetate/propionate family kinase [Methylococcales bacterium]